MTQKVRENKENKSAFPLSKNPMMRDIWYINTRRAEWWSKIAATLPVYYQFAASLLPACCQIFLPRRCYLLLKQTLLLLVMYWKVLIYFFLLEFRIVFLSKFLNSLTAHFYSWFDFLISNFLKVFLQWLNIK